VRGGIDAVDLLESICEAHQAGCVPHPAQVPKSERTIVEAAAGTEAYAAAIETYQRDKHHIEPAGAKRLTALRCCRGPCMGTKRMAPEARRRSMRGRKMRQPRSAARLMSGAASSSQGSAA